MKKFRIKNLTIPIDSTVEYKPTPNTLGPVCPGGVWPSFKHPITLTCPAISIDPGCRNFISIEPYPCGHNFSTVPPTDFTELIKFTPQVTDKLELIESMKADLKLAVSNLDKVEKEISISAQPQTLGEANEIETNLEAALKEVKSLKATLK